MAFQLETVPKSFSAFILAGKALNFGGFIAYSIAWCEIGWLVHSRHRVLDARTGIKTIKNSFALL